MSDVMDIAETEAPRRGRPPRAEAQATHRRRRQAGSLNRMVQFKLDIFTPDQLDLANYVYYWANDEGTNIRQMTKLDDYDFVSTDEIAGGFDPSSVDAESDGRIRILVGTQKGGNPLYAYYLKKPRAFWEADNEQVVRNREDMMAGRVRDARTGYINPETGESDAVDPREADNFYATPGNTLGGSAQRRRSGPVSRTLT